MLELISIKISIKKKKKKRRRRRKRKEEEEEEKAKARIDSSNLCPKFSHATKKPPLSHTVM